MYSDLDKKKFDVVIIGTSLTEAIISSYMSKLKKTVLHLDNNNLYGGDCKNFNFKEFQSYKNKLIYPNHNNNNNKLNADDNEISKKNSLEEYYKNGEIIKPNLSIFDNDTKENLREYNIELNHKILFSNSIATQELSESKASNYLEFQTVKSCFIYYDNIKITVPTNKSEILFSDQLNNSEKQKLFNFLMAVNKLMPVEDDLNSIDDFKKNTEIDNNIVYNNIINNRDKDIETFLSLSDNKQYSNSNNKKLSDKLCNLIKYILANDNVYDLSSKSNYTVNDMLIKIKKYLSSVNVYSKNPYLYPLYGSSDFSQALCRMSSVYQGSFVINDNIKIHIKRNNVTNLEYNFFLKIEDQANNEEFYVDTNMLVLNEIFLDSRSVTFENIEIKNNQLNKLNHKIIWFYIIEIPVEYKQGPIYGKVPKNSIFDNSNQIGFEIVEFFANSSTTPLNRSLILFSFVSDTIDKANLINISQDISIKYLNNIIIPSYKDANKDVNMCSIIASFGFYHEINMNSYYISDTNNDHISICKNNYIDFDIDYYFAVASKILKKHKIDIDIKNENKSLENNNNINNFDEEDKDFRDDLLDDLMSYVDK